MATSIIIGAGPAGMRIARQLARYDDVLVLDADTESPQATEARPQLLTHLHAGHTQTNPLPPPPLAPGIHLLAGRKVVHIDRHSCQVIDDSDQVHAYSQLFLALGSSPLRPTLPGSQLDGVQTLYTRRQLDTLTEALARKGQLLIVGGGLLAVELAALVAKRTSVTLIVRSRLLGRYLNSEMSARVAQRLKKLGVEVMEQAVAEHLLGSEHVAGVMLADGRQLEARQVVLACGIVPNTRLARDAGLNVEEGVLVDAHMRSINDASIFAVGDCAQPPWPVMRGNIAQVLHLADLALATARNEPPPASPAGLYQECWLGDGYRLVMAAVHLPAGFTADRSYFYRWAGRALSATVQQQRVATFQALLPDAQAQRLTALWQDSVVLSRWELMTLRRLAWLPPRRHHDPLICQCASVRLSTINAAIAEHGNDPALICQATQAGTYCGNCLEDINALCGNSSWRNHVGRWSVVTTVLLIVMLLGSLQVWSLPDSVLLADFGAYRLMTDSGIREVSGYLLTIIILMALVIRGNRRRYWWHILLGSIALLLVPLHSLGGLITGAGLNASLVGLMLLTALSGILLKIHRRGAELRFGHLTATLVLLAATLLHIVFIYAY